jgi:hypothetical protein
MPGTNTSLLGPFVIYEGSEVLSIRHGQDHKHALYRYRFLLYQFLKLQNWYRWLSHQNFLPNTGLASIKLTYQKLMIQYFATQNNISAISRKYQDISFLSSFIGFRPFQTHCTILCSCLPIEMTWNQVFLSETGGKLRLCFGKMIWNWVFDIKKSQFLTIFIWIFI